MIIFEVLDVAENLSHSDTNMMINLVNPDFLLTHSAGDGGDKSRLSVNLLVTAPWISWNS